MYKLREMMWNVVPPSKCITDHLPNVSLFLFPLLTAKREGACRQTKSILLYAFFNAEAVGFLNRFFDGSFSYAPLLWTILLCGGILLFFIAAERTVYLWQERPLP